MAKLEHVSFSLSFRTMRRKTLCWSWRTKKFDFSKRVVAFIVENGRGKQSAQSNSKEGSSRFSGGRFVELWYIFSTKSNHIMDFVGWLSYYFYFPGEKRMDFEDMKVETVLTMHEPFSGCGRPARKATI